MEVGTENILLWVNPVIPLTGYSEHKILMQAGYTSPAIVWLTAFTLQHPQRGSSGSSCVPSCVPMEPCSTCSSAFTASHGSSSATEGNSPTGTASTSLQIPVLLPLPSKTSMLSYLSFTGKTCKNNVHLSSILTTPFAAARHTSCP